MGNLSIPLRMPFLAGMVLVLAVALPNTVSAGSRDFQLWIPVYLTVNFTDTIHGWYEVQPRFGDDVSQVNQLLLRTAFGYRFAEHWSIWQGYAWTPDIEPTFKTESRIYQQLLYVQQFPAIKLMSRTRFEQRWIEDVSGTSLRFRTLLRGQVPLDRQKLWGVVVQDEVFFHVNSPTNGPDSGFDQNRVFIGINRVLNTHLNMDIGYQLQAINTDKSGSFNDKNHILLLQAFLTW